MRRDGKWKEKEEEKASKQQKEAKDLQKDNWLSPLFNFYVLYSFPEIRVTMSLYYLRHLGGLPDLKKRKIQRDYRLNLKSR